MLMEGGVALLVTLLPGDTLWTISQWYNVPLQLVMDSNRELDPQQLAAGQEVRVPGYETVPYSIRSSDTLWMIAQSQGVTVEAVLRVNPGIQPQRLYVGQRIQVPSRVRQLVVRTDRPYTYASMEEDLRRLMDIYPFLRMRSIGSSVMGKSIPEVLVGRGTKRVHVNASFHANEWITTSLLMRFLNEYLIAASANGAIRGVWMPNTYDMATLSMVPMVNPDGVDLVVEGPPAEYRERVVTINNGSTNFSGWKANIRGVDLNNQFPAKWEIEAGRKALQPAPRDYAGPSPLSEPESQAMAELTRSGNFTRVLAFHTQGKVIYWGFEDLQPPAAVQLASEFGRVSGYRPVETVNSYAGYKDWFIQEWRRPGFTIEAGQGVNPLPLSQFEEIYQENVGILLVHLLY